jgi:hypothetical protein
MSRQTFATTRTNVAMSIMMYLAVSRRLLRAGITGCILSLLLLLLMSYEGFPGNGFIKLMPCEAFSVQTTRTTKTTSSNGREMIIIALHGTKPGRQPTWLMSQSDTNNDNQGTPTSGLIRNSDRNGRADGWEQQKSLLQSMKARESRTRKDIALQKYRQRSLALIYDTAYFGFFLFCVLWVVLPNPFVPLSYAVGATCGVAYAYGLSKYVETVGATVEEATEASEGAGVGAARFAFLALLFVVVSKFRSQGLLEIPAILGFFTYQIASLNQGLREIND